MDKNWISIHDKLPDKSNGIEYLVGNVESVPVEILIDNEEITEADYLIKEERFQYMFGNFYIAEKKNDFKEFRIHDVFTKSKVTHWRPFNG